MPERDFAVVALSNAGSNGIPFNQAVVGWTLQHYRGVTDRDPKPLSYDESRAWEIVGSYENDVMTLTIGTDGVGLRLEIRMKPEFRAAADKELLPGYPPAAIGLLPGNTDEYILTSGAFKGPRDKSGAVVGVDLAGRLFNRVPTASEGSPVSGLARVGTLSIASRCSDRATNETALQSTGSKTPRTPIRGITVATDSPAAMNPPPLPAGPQLQHGPMYKQRNSAHSLNVTCM